MLIPTAVILVEFGEGVRQAWISTPPSLVTSPHPRVDPLLELSLLHFLAAVKMQSMLCRGKEGEDVGLTLAASAKVLFPKDILSVVGVLLN